MEAYTTGDKWQGKAQTGLPRAGGSPVCQTCEGNWRMRFCAGKQPAFPGLRLMGLVAVLPVVAAQLALADEARADPVREDGLVFLEVVHDRDKKKYSQSEAMALYSDVTNVHYTRRRGIQFEYTSPDGSAHQWLAGNEDVIKGEWQIRMRRKSAQICFAWMGPLGKARPQDFECANVKEHQSGWLDRVVGDQFQLQSRDVAPGLLSHGARMGQTRLTQDEEIRSLPRGAMRKLPAGDFTGTLEKVTGLTGKALVTGLHGGAGTLSVTIETGGVLCTPGSARRCGYGACRVDGKVRKAFRSYLKKFKGQTILLSDLSGVTLRSTQVKHWIGLKGHIVLEDGRLIGEVMRADGWGFNPGDTMPERFWRKPGCGAPV